MPTKEEILELQHALRQQGSYPIARTGTLDKATREALAAYQRRRGVPPTGEFNDATRIMLGWKIDLTLPEEA